jgi:hypothetical protein
MRIKGELPWENPYAMDRLVEAQTRHQIVEMLKFVLILNVIRDPKRDNAQDLLRITRLVFPSQDSEETLKDKIAMLEEQVKRPLIVQAEEVDVQDGINAMFDKIRQKKKNPTRRPNVGRREMP